MEHLSRTRLLIAQLPRDELNSLLWQILDEEDDDAIRDVIWNHAYSQHRRKLNTSVASPNNIGCENNIIHQINSIASAMIEQQTTVPNDTATLGLPNLTIETDNHNHFTLQSISDPVINKIGNFLECHTLTCFELTNRRVLIALRYP
eukprot:729388_1